MLLHRAIVLRKNDTAHISVSGIVKVTSVKTPIGNHYS